MRSQGKALLFVVLLLAGCAYHTGGGARELGSTDPAISRAVKTGVTALISRQHRTDGSWGGDDVKVQSPHKSDYPVAISSLAYLALMTVAPKDPDALRARRQSLRFILDTIDAEGNMADTRDHTPKVHERNIWSQGFCLFVLGHVLREDLVAGASRKEIRTKMALMVAALAATQQGDGGWTYDEGPSESFTTATVLMGLLSARGAGTRVPDALIQKPTEFLKRVSNPGFYVAYQGVPRVLDRGGDVRDSIGRSVQLELALLKAGNRSIEPLQAAVDTFFEHRARIDEIRDLEEGCHQPPHRIGTFYCFFDYFYTAEAVEHLDTPARDTYRRILRHHILHLQKEDGHWLDSRDHCGESYGTAMGLLILSAPGWANPEPSSQRQAPPAPTLP